MPCTHSPHLSRVMHMQVWDDAMGQSIKKQVCHDHQASCSILSMSMCWNPFPKHTQCPIPRSTILVLTPLL